MNTQYKTWNYQLKQECPQQQANTSYYQQQLFEDKIKRINNSFIWIISMIVFYAVLSGYFILSAFSFFNNLNYEDNNIFYNLFMKKIFQILFCLAVFFLLMNLWTYLVLIFSNPGIQKYVDIEIFIKQRNEYPMCLKCGKLKKPNTIHQPYTKKCIQQYHGYFGAIANVVGKNNFKFFVLYFFYISIVLIFAIILGIFNFIFIIKEIVYSYKSLQNSQASKYHLKQGILYLFLLIAFILTFIFTICVLYISLKVTINNLTWKILFIIPRLNNTTIVEKIRNEINMFSRFQNFKRVFGESVFLWFLPLQNNFLSNV